MRERGVLAILALGACALSAPALADDPNDRLTPDELARDRAIIRQLNQDQLAQVRQRDARYADGWDSYARARNGWRDGEDGNARPASRDDADYAARREYQDAMAEWRADVRACREGDYSRCARR
ncbi:hypothetical protein SAMN05518801_10977 [Novosphingobium sp. CF614]|uniref:hypothetical protein n=1 Tax=Novosphingobium sp. CF614 TaxID=1884364 RepID=UPI0008F3D788|nr:hypothetical protein [Novosphingobium sp. CF614]SFG17899.1 hypothetical protein SAMN05518801_10977 [Novosphingobium sp. CF614]